MVYMINLTISITFFAGICVYIVAGVDDLASIMNIIDQNASKGSNSTQNRLKIKCLLYELIQLHQEFLK